MKGLLKTLEKARKDQGVAVDFMCKSFRWAAG